MLAALVVCLIGLVAGAAIGVVQGFALAAHGDALRGVRPVTRSRLIRFLARPTAQMSVVETMLLLLMMAVWVVVFFALALLPGVAADRLAGHTPQVMLVAYGGVALAWWLGQRFGAHAWRTLT